MDYIKEHECNGKETKRKAINEIKELMLNRPDGELEIVAPLHGELLSMVEKDKSKITVLGLNHNEVVRKAPKELTVDEAVAVVKALRKVCTDNGGGDEDGTFAVCKVSRDDLRERGFYDEVTDEDMGQIAHIMEQLYLNGDYWEHLEYAADEIGVPRSE